MNSSIANNEEGKMNKSCSQTLWNSLSSARDQRGGRAVFACYRDRLKWRKYGDLKSFCWSSHMLSPLSSFWWLSELFVVVTTLLFILELYSKNTVLTVVTSGLGLFQLTAFYKTCLRDPGVLPRPDLATGFRNLLGVVSLPAFQSDPGIQQICKVRAGFKGKNEKQIFCWKCNHYRPPKAFHCDDCDCCILDYEHHCPVYGGCVTDKNNVSFLMMVLGQLMFWCCVWGYSIYCLFTFDNLGNGLLMPLVVLIEFLVAILVPLMAFLCKEKICIRPNRVGMPLKIEEKDVEELLYFAVINNFTEKEIDDIYKLYHGGSSSTSMGGKGDMMIPASSTIDVNQNPTDNNI